MQKELKQLVSISRYYGGDPDYVIAGGGNTSYKDDRFIWVKASGVAMANITEDGFVQLYRDKLKIVGRKKYSGDVHKREEEVKEDLMAARVYPEKGKRPSVETSLHDLIEYPFVVHTHPTLVNVLMCAQQAKEKTKELFGEKALFGDHGAGYSLFIKMKDALKEYRSKYVKHPQLIFLRNHGIFVSGMSTEEIRQQYEKVMGTLKELVNVEKEEELPLPGKMPLILDKIRELSGGKKVMCRHNTLHRFFYGSRESFGRIARPFTPDIVVYCGSSYIYIGEEDIDAILKSLEKEFEDYRRKYKKEPKVILIKGYGLIGLGDTESSARIVLDVFEDFMKISKYTDVFGGPHPLSEDDIDFLDHWEVEQYRRKIGKAL